MIRPQYPMHKSCAATSSRQHLASKCSEQVSNTCISSRLCCNGLVKCSLPAQAMVYRTLLSGLAEACLADLALGLFTMHMLDPKRELSRPVSSCLAPHAQHAILTAHQNITLHPLCLVSAAKSSLDSHTNVVVTSYFPGASILWHVTPPSLAKISRMYCRSESILGSRA